MDTTTIKETTQKTNTSDNTSIDWKKRGKYAAATLGGLIGIVAPGAVLTSGKSAAKKAASEQEPQETPSTDQAQEQIEELPREQQNIEEFEQSFAQAREEGNRVFQFEGRLYHSFIKEEWDALSIEEKQAVVEEAKEFFEEDEEADEVTEEVAEEVTEEVAEEVEPLPDVFTVSTLVDDTMELETAILTGREEGADFIEWQGDLYPTHTQEEFDQMPEELQDCITQITEEHDIQPPVFNTLDENTGYPKNPPIITHYTYDFDGDGKPDNILYVESIHGDTMFIDTTQSGQPNIVLMDTTGDGKFDTKLVDTDGDGIIDTKMIDTTGDGLFDTTYQKSPEGEWIVATPDTNEYLTTPDIDPIPDTESLLS